MNKFQKKMWLCASIVLSSTSLHAMLVNACRSYSGVLSVASRRISGITPALQPQTATGMLGEFKLNEAYGINTILAPYIAKNQNISEKEACLEHWRETKRAYNQFLTHNSALAIRKAFMKTEITSEYAKRAFLFSLFVARAFERYIEHHQQYPLCHQDDATKQMYVDATCWSDECLQLQKYLKKEQENIGFELEAWPKALNENATNKE